MVAYIESTNDEELLLLMREDFVFYGKVKDVDITDGLSVEQLKELKALSDEYETKDTPGIDDFKKATQ